ncbi:MAG: DUF2271 domain-containing protein [Deltaproteobacteria bacterium]|nr:DUF2271 domain-containing protein [Deltaproteobacteria bacterium]
MLKLAAISLLLSACIVGEVRDFPDPDNDPADDQDPAPPQDPEPETPTGTLAITMSTTTKVGALFAPNNVVAVWIEDAAGNFVKTIDRWSQVRTQHLVAWRTAAGTADVDSVSGASRLDHATPIQIQWKLKDRNRNPVPDGVYTVRMESAEANSVSEAENNQGTFTFTSGALAETQTALASGGFTNVSLTYTPPP